MDAPILIFAMAKMVNELRQVGIEVIFHFPGRAMMTRFFKQRFGGYGEVPEIIRNMPKFKALWEGQFNVFDKLQCNDIKLKFCCPTNNQDGMQIPHKIRRSREDRSKASEMDDIKFKAYIGNIQSDVLSLNLLVMTGNPLFPLRYEMKLMFPRKREWLNFDLGNIWFHY